MTDVSFEGMAKASLEYSMQWTGPPGLGPVRAHEGDAGFDLFVSESVRIPVGGYANVPHGIRIQMPRGVWGLLTTRSSTLRSRGLIVVNGVIDNGYRGDMSVMCFNASDQVVELELGDRIAQLILFSLIAPSAVRVAELGRGDREENGFGSTGR